MTTPQVTRLKATLDEMTAERRAIADSLRETRPFVIAYVLEYEREGRAVPDDIRKVVESFEFAFGSLLARAPDHDAGAYARCSFCHRYSASALTLSGHIRVYCECGRNDGWSGSFIRPTPQSKWSITQRLRSNGEDLIP